MKCPLSYVLVGALGALAATTAAQAPAPVPGSAYTYAIPPALSDGWATGGLEQAGIDRHRLEQMTEAIRSHPDWNIHAVLIEHAGRLVYEEYFSGEDARWDQDLGVVTFTRGTLHDLRSVTKSVVSALVGIAKSSGAIPSLDAPLVDYFPEYKELDVPERRRITIRHALTMSAGFEWHEDIPYDAKNDEVAMNGSPDPIHFVLARPIVSAPGALFRYNGGTVQVLGTIVQRATKQPLAGAARAMLFSPLGITETEWLGNLAGVPSAASGLRLRPRDLAKFGSLYLHDGRWNGRQILPSEWVQESTRRRLTRPGPESVGYAYLWWLACYPTPPGVVEVPTAVGNGMQRIFLLRAHQTVVTVLGGRYDDRDQNTPEHLLVDFLLPALPPPAATSKCPS